MTEREMRLRKYEHSMVGTRRNIQTSKWERRARRLEQTDEQQQQGWNAASEVGMGQ